MTRGFKAFNYDMTNHYGIKFEEGLKYSINAGEIVRYGKQGSGFHFASHLEDTLRYVDGMKEPIVIASVIGSGCIVEGEDEYYGYYNQYAAEHIYVEHIYTREEILNYILNLSDFNRINRFLSGYRLTEEEIKLFEYYYIKNEKILDTISYYQKGDLETYNRKYKKR